eukprot:TRINITY_DN13619_c0_g1_i1.p1 TRINITY_DN13619_c0_g1~~TRINITY_DN13619_c0_g1_i1.p1  ORF type:complete len:229 (+),score=-7.99 TRINITY_DN13619_c0_g1_i1:73-687(+)
MQKTVKICKQSQLQNILQHVLRLKSTPLSFEKMLFLSYTNFQQEESQNIKFFQKVPSYLFRVCYFNHVQASCNLLHMNIHLHNFCYLFHTTSKIKIEYHSKFLLEYMNIFISNNLKKKLKSTQFDLFGQLMKVVSQIQLQYCNVTKKDATKFQNVYFALNSRKYNKSTTDSKDTHNAILVLTHQTIHLINQNKRLKVEKHTTFL